MYHPYLNLLLRYGFEGQSLDASGNYEIMNFSWVMAQFMGKFHRFWKTHESGDDSCPHFHAISLLSLGPMIEYINIVEKDK